MLNMIKVELRLIQDPVMYKIFEKGARVGVSYISNRYTDFEIRLGTRRLSRLLSREISIFSNVRRRIIAEGTLS